MSSVADLDQKLEVIVIPVSDVDRATDFYRKLGWRQDVTPPGSGVVQLTPHGSGCSIQFGATLTSAAPGSAKGYLIVSDIVAARDALVAAGAEVDEVFHLGPDGPVSGPDPERRSYFSFASFSDPDGNDWLMQEITTRLPGRVDADRDFVRLRQRPGERDAARGGRPRRAREANRTDETRTGPTGTPRTWSRSSRARNCPHERLRRRSFSAAEHPASTARRRWRRAGCASPSSSESWSAASAPTGPASRRSRCCARARRCTPRARRARARRSTFRTRWRGGTSWCRTTPTPARSAGWGAGASPCCAARASSPAPARSRWTASVTRPTTSSSRPAPTRSSHRFRGCASSRACGPTARRPA